MGGEASWIEWQGRDVRRFLQRLPPVEACAAAATVAHGHGRVIYSTEAHATRRSRHDPTWPSAELVLYRNGPRHATTLRCRGCEDEGGCCQALARGRGQTGAALPAVARPAQGGFRK